ncbi:LysR family transcriptional regulator [Chloroflexia bacterium SDU3-3]|nr:LysR family transcriptional regulator [Chloroflexia bacterium SDU3-3]
MNLHLVRLFAAVAAEQSFSRAAERLYISQPAISKGIQELERQLDAKLIDRSASPIGLTEAGRLLQRYAAQIFAAERGAERALAQLHNLERGHLTIGASSTIGIYMLPALLGTYHQRHPGVELVLDIGNTQQILDRLTSMPLDMAFVEGPVDAEGVATRPWRSDTLVAIAAPAHPLAVLPRVTLAQIQGAPFIVREHGSGTREVTEAALREHHVEIQIAMELGSTEAIKQAVMARLGIAIVSEATVSAELESGRLVVLDVEGLRIQRMLSTLHVAGRPASRALEAFELLLDEV